MPSLGGWELVIILGVLVLLFGASQLPAMARSMGQSARVFKGEMKGLQADGATTEDEAPTQPAVAEHPVQHPAASVQATAPASQVRGPSRTGQGHSGAGQ
jgi:sec-independent protein translocase protein TatA